MCGYRIGPRTRRLEHRAFKPEDAKAFLAINSDPEVLRHTGDSILSSVSEATTFIRNYPDFDDPGFGRWACILRAKNEIVGPCGLKFLPEIGEVDVGYRFLPQFAMTIQPLTQNSERALGSA